MLPPVEYDKPYDGKQTLIRVKTEKEVAALCPATAFRYKLACAFPASSSCRIIMVTDDVIARAGYATDIVYRHELGHCNGWPSSHWGARMAPSPAQADLTEMAKNLPNSVKRGLGLIP